MILSELLVPKFGMKQCILYRSKRYHSNCDFSLVGIKSVSSYLNKTQWSCQHGAHSRHLWVVQFWQVWCRKPLGKVALQHHVLNLMPKKSVVQVTGHCSLIYSQGFQSTLHSTRQKNERVWKISEVRIQQMYPKTHATCYWFGMNTIHTNNNLIKSSGSGMPAW